MTDTDTEVERIAELAWRAYTQCTFVGAWPRGAVWENDWRRVARAVIADRAAQPPATDGPTLMEAIRERDDARRDAKRTAAECDRAVADARRERDAARTRAVAAEHERDSVRVTLADCVKALGHTRAERDEARELYTRAEQQRCDALTVAEANLRRAEIAEAERDVLQSRLDAMRREPTEADVRELREHITGSPLGWDDLSREAWIIVRDTLLTAQEPPAIYTATETGSSSCAPSVAPAPTFPRPCDALLDPSDGTRCQLAENHDGECYVQPAPPTLSPADTLDSAEEMLRRIAASARLDLDATEAAAIVAELDRLRAERAAMSARATVAETRHAAESEHLIAHGRSVERAAIVAWLRDCAEYDMADRIERGDHLAAKEPQP